MCQYGSVKHVPYWGVTNIRCCCAKWSYLGNVRKMWAPLSEWHSGACRDVWKEMRPVCPYRQHLFGCGHGVFHSSYTTADEWNEPLLEVVFERTIICWCYIAWYVSCDCTHVTWHNGTLKDCLIDIELRTSMFCFYSDILWDFHMILGENRTHTEQDI